MSTENISTPRDATEIAEKDYTSYKRSIDNLNDALVDAVEADENFRFSKDNNQERLKDTLEAADTDYKLSQLALKRVFQTGARNYQDNKDLYRTAAKHEAGLDGVKIEE